MLKLIHPLAGLLAHAYPRFGFHHGGFGGLLLMAILGVAILAVIMIISLDKSK